MKTHLEKLVSAVGINLTIVVLVMLACWVYAKQPDVDEFFDLFQPAEPLQNIEEDHTDILPLLPDNRGCEPKPVDVTTTGKEVAGWYVTPVDRGDVMQL